MEDFVVGVLPNDNPITAIMQSGYNLGYDTGYRAGIKAAQPKWISVEEPPKHTCDYLVYVWVAYPDGIAHMQMRTGIYNIVRKEWTIPHDRFEVIGVPEYWMPLPSMEGLE